LATSRSDFDAVKRARLKEPEYDLDNFEDELAAEQWQWRNADNAAPPERKPPSVPSASKAFAEAQAS